jgi:hypothetical protein
MGRIVIPFPRRNYHPLLTRQVQLGVDCQFLTRRPNKQTLWRVFFGGRWLVALYDDNRRRVVEVFPDRPPAA